MGYKVIFAPQALEQLEEIVRFIAQDDPRAAERFGNHLVDGAELLADFPELGNAVSETPKRATHLVQALLYLLSCPS